MRRKNLFLMAAAVFTILVWSSAAFAADTITVNVTSEPIHYHSPSDKAGGFTLTFDAGSTIAVGDQITIDLTYGTTLAQSININIAQGASTTPWTGIPTAGAPIIYTGAAPTYGGAGGGVYFHVYGTVGTQRITVDVLGTAGDNVTVGPAAGVDTVILSFLGQKVNAGFATPGIYNAATGLAATIGENTLCINVSTYDGTVVRGSMDSLGDKFLFVPSDPEIAHVVEELAISFDPCKGAAPGYIIIGDRITQGSESCTYFDNETSYGYCLYTHNANDAILASTGPLDMATYTVKLDILVNGAGGNNGVYWTNQQLGADAFTSDPGCGTSLPPIVGTYTYLNGAMAPASAGPPNVGECDVSSFPIDYRAVTLISPQTTLNIAAGDDYLAFDFPALNYDLDEITAGDVVTIRITILKIPCGSIFTGDLQIGTFGCLSAPQVSGLLFPYFTQIGASADLFWDGIAITNPGMNAASAVITVFEADGDQGTITVSIPAMSQYVSLLSSIAFVHTVGTGSLGDSTCYVMVNVTGVSGIDGFAMIARQDTGESMGYLPRQLY